MNLYRKAFQRKLQLKHHLGLGQNQFQTHLIKAGNSHWQLLGSDAFFLNDTNKYSTHFQSIDYLQYPLTKRQTRSLNYSGEQAPKDHIATLTATFPLFLR